MLTPVTGQIFKVNYANLRGLGRIGRADLAHAMLAMIGDPATYHRGVGVAYWATLRVALWNE